MKKDNPFTEDDVHEYVDGHMSCQRRQEFEAFLEMNSEIAGVVESYKRQNQMLRALFGGGLSNRARNENGRGSPAGD